MKRPVLTTATLSVAAVVSGLILMSASSVAAGSLPTLTLALTKNTITVGGSQVSGAVNIVATVTGEKSDNPALVRLNPGISVAAFAKAAKSLGNSPLDALDPYGSIVYFGSAIEGAPSSAQTWLQPGTYVALNNGNGHAIFTITASANPVLLPAPAAEIDAVDFGFRGADTLHDGDLVRFKNDGYLVHMFLFAQAKSAADAAKAEKLLLANKGNEAGKLYGTGVTGQFVGPLSHAHLQQEVINEPPGVYVIYCAMNAEDGREHFQLGMFRTITIVK